MQANNGMINEDKSESVGVKGPQVETCMTSRRTTSVAKSSSDSLAPSIFIYCRYNSHHVYPPVQYIQHGVKDYFIEFGTFSSSQLGISKRKRKSVNGEIARRGKKRKKEERTEPKKTETLTLSSVVGIVGHKEVEHLIGGGAIT